MISPVTFPDSITHSWEGKERKKAAGIELQSSHVFHPACRGSETQPSEFKPTWNCSFCNDVEVLDRTVLIAASSWFFNSFKE